MNNLKKFVVHPPAMSMVVGVYYEPEDFWKKVKSEISRELDTNEEATLKESSTPENIMSFFQYYEDISKELCTWLTRIASHCKEQKMLFLSPDDARRAFVNYLGILISENNKEEENESGNSTDKTPEDTTSVSD